jgi:hypothetical protein
MEDLMEQTRDKKPKKVKENRPARGLGRKRRREVYLQTGRREENKRRKKVRHAHHLELAKLRRQRKIAKK